MPIRFQDNRIITSTSNGTVFISGHSTKYILNDVNIICRPDVGQGHHLFNDMKSTLQKICNKAIDLLIGQPEEKCTGVLVVIQILRQIGNSMDGIRNNAGTEYKVPITERLSYKNDVLFGTVEKKAIDFVFGYLCGKFDERQMSKKIDRLWAESYDKEVLTKRMQSDVSNVTQQMNDWNGYKTNVIFQIKELRKELKAIGI